MVPCLLAPHTYIASLLSYVGPQATYVFDDQQTYFDPNQPPTISKIAYHSSLGCLSDTAKLVIFSIIESILPVESF